MCQIYLHIDTLKTGTTSFQRWFSDHAESIATTNAVRWYQGKFSDAREIAAICLDPDRQSPSMPSGFFPPRHSSEWDTWENEIRLNIAQQLSDHTSALLISCEDLCLLRSTDELTRLAELFPPEETSIILTLRNKKDFLKSWRQHLRNDFFRLSSDPTSFAYVKKNSWLVDYVSLISAYQQTYGAQIVILNYDEAVLSEGSIIPALTRAAHLNDPLPNWSGYHFNKSNRPPRPPVKGLARPVHYIRFYRWKVFSSIKRRLSST